MLEKIKKLSTHPKLKALGDVRNLGLIVFCVIVLLVTWSTVKVVQTNYGLQKQISVLEQQNEVAELENNNLKLKNQYFNTDAYLELAARRHFNKALPGETLLIVPKEVALAHTIDMPVPKSSADVATDAVERSSGKLERNFNAWLDFLFHRQPSD
jgi:cell division protein FtsB